MAGPWEKYQAAPAPAVADGPWSKYAGTTALPEGPPTAGNPVSGKTNAGLAFIEGAADIGRTILRLTAPRLTADGPFDAEANRKDVRNALVGLGYRPDEGSASAGRFGAHVMGTAGIPMAPARFGVGEAAFVLPWFLRAVPNAASGAAMAGLVNPDDMGAGAVAGALVPPVVEGVVAPVVSKVGAPAANWLVRLLKGEVVDDRAANLLQKAAADPQTRGQLIEALGAAEASGLPQNAAQGASSVNAPIVQSLLDDAVHWNPAVMQDNSNLLASQHFAGQNALARVAGGATAVDQRFARETAKGLTNQTLGPAREAVLTAANQGSRIASAEAEAARMGEAASNKVTDAGRFTAAGERASGEVARAATDAELGFTTISPLTQERWAQLANRAEMTATDSANASLLFGEARRHAQMVADSIRAHGHKPLDVTPVLARLDRLAGTPAYKANTLLQDVVAKVRTVIEANVRDGTIDSFLLDAVRKDTVNTAIEGLVGGGLKKEAQRNLAAKVMTELKPSIVRAIDDAAGMEGAYGKYLEDYSAEMQKIAEQRLGGKALELWNSNKEAFVNFVNGARNKDVKEVEKILGPGQYDAMRDLSDEYVGVLRRQADMAVRDIAVKKQANEGTKALAELVKNEIRWFQIPRVLKWWATASNAGIAQVEAALDRKTRDALAQAARTPGGTKALLERLPPEARSKVLQAVRDPEKWIRLSNAATRATANNLAPEQDETVNRLKEMP